MFQIKNYFISAYYIKQTLKFSKRSRIFKALKTRQYNKCFYYLPHV